MFEFDFWRFSIWFGTLAKRQTPENFREKFRNYQKNMGNLCWKNYYYYYLALKDNWFRYIQAFQNNILVYRNLSFRGQKSDDVSKLIKQFFSFSVN